MTQTTNRPLSNLPRHDHPDHSCPRCLAEENAERVGHEPREDELHPDHVPPPPPRRAYTYEGGPLHGRQRVSRMHPDWRTAAGQPTTPRSRTWLDRRYETDHEEGLYRWRQPVPEARYRYEGGPLDGRSFVVGSEVVITTWRTYEGCPIERGASELERYYVLDREARTYRARPPHRT